MRGEGSLDQAIFESLVVDARRLAEIRKIGTS
jgi:hypothetical protein